MKIENVQLNLADTVPNEEEHKAKLPSKTESHGHKLKRKFKRKLKAAKATGKRAKRDAKRACHAQRKAERERDTVAAENALLKKRLASRDKDVTNALRGEDGFIRLKERNGNNE